MTQLYHHDTFAYGIDHMALRVPQHNFLGTFMPGYHPGVAHETGEILRALQEPIGTPTLQDIIDHKHAKQTFVVVNDGSRPTVTHKLLLPLMQDLTNNGIAWLKPVSLFKPAYGNISLYAVVARLMRAMTSFCLVIVIFGVL
jgi:hypothetical protein